MCIFNSGWNWLSANFSNFIAMCAFVATFWQAHISRKHNKLSVRPHLTLFFDNSTNGEEFQLTLQNNGVGSALIKKSILIIDGHEIKGNSLQEKIDSIKMKLFPTYGLNLAYGGIDEKEASESKYMMSIGEKITLLKFVFNSAKLPSVTIVDDARNRIKVQIHYESIYKEKFSLHE